MIDATSRFDTARVAALIVLATLLGGAAPTPTSAPAAPGERIRATAAANGVTGATPAATASVPPPGTPTAVAAPTTLKGVVVAVGGGQMRGGTGGGDGTGRGGGAGTGRGGADAARGGGDGKGSGGGDGKGRGRGDAKGGGGGKGGGDGMGRGGGSGRARGSGEGGGRGAGNGAGRGDGSGGGNRSEVSEGGGQRRGHGKRLHRGQMLLAVDGDEMLVEVGRGPVPGDPPIAVGDHVSVTGVPTTRGSRKVIRATRIARGSETYEIKPMKPRVRSTPRNSATPAPTDSKTR